MTIQITREYSRAVVAKSENGLDDVIKTIYCIVTAVDSDTGARASVGKDFVLPEPNPQEFIPYTSITQEIVDAWVTVQPEYIAMADAVQADLASKPPVEVKNLPWVSPPPPPPLNPVPESVSPLQIRLALNMTGLRESVDAYVATLDQTARDAWEYATVIDRDNDILVNGAIALGKTTEDIDNLFILAGSLVP